MWRVAHNIHPLRTNLEFGGMNTRE